MRKIVKRSKNVDIILSLNNVPLERVCSYKYLGFILDDHLNFNKHINSMVSTVSHKLYILEYGNIIYSGTSKTNLDKLDKLFYRGLRICDSSNNNRNRNQLCHVCKISPLENRREVQLMLFMHKQTQNLDLLKKKKTRLHSAPVFKTYKPNNEKASHNVIYRGAMCWNEISVLDRNKNLNDFKTKIRCDKL